MPSDTGNTSKISSLSKKSCCGWRKPRHRECSNLGMPFVLLGSDALNKIRLDFKYRQCGLTMWFGAGQHEVTHTNPLFSPESQR